MRLLVLLLFSPFFAISQTVGTLVYEQGIQEGYTFFSPFSGTRAYLIDNCGRRINQWNRGTRPGLSAYFLENGLLFRTYKPSPAGPFTSASNAGGLELVDWDNNTVWSWELNTPTEITHHDAVYMPNGHILVLSWELVYTDELIELGRDPDEIAPQGFMWSERIIELEPVDNADVNIVWEWRIKDHYIQDFDSTKLNYGVVSEHPELFNINLPELNSSNSNSSRDWNHFNAIDYNPELDQILISVRNSDEIWIIDHSTSTAEAATHNGGIYGRGGDILYRWGNASAYDRGPLSEQKLFGQHGVQWIRDSLNDAGKIILFNNGNGRPGPDYSTAEVIFPPQDSLGFYSVPATEPFGPPSQEIIYGNSSSEYYYSAYLSNAQRLPNGNTLINAGSPGRIFEVDQSKNIVWAYEVPLNGDSPAAQGQTPNNNSTFRAYKYTADYPGFENLDLTPGLTIESGINPIDCQSTSTEALSSDSGPSIRWNPLRSECTITNPGEEPLRIVVTDAHGMVILDQALNTRTRVLELSTWPNGLYFINARGKRSRAQSVIPLVK